MPGTVLLLAASPVGKSRLVDAASVLPVLAAVPPAVLSGTDTANVVELADPLEPQAVLTRLRAVAATPGPLTVFVTGQLALDRRQHLPHLALARTTPATVRYTALPWQWIREEFRLRSPGSTTLFVDLHADADAWGWLRTHTLDSGRNNAVLGRIAPPPSRRTVASPAYMKTIATILRSGWRPPVEQLHQQAFTRLGPEAYGDLVLTVPPVPVAAPVAYRAGGPRAQAAGGVVGAGRVPQAAAVAPPQPDGPRRPEAYGDTVLTVPPVPVAAPIAYRAGGPRAQAAGGAVDVDGAPQAAAAAPPQSQDPHVQVTTAVQAGRHQEADALAAAHEQAAARAHGPASEQALHWSEVRADLAMFARDSARSCRIWLTVAETRLAAGQAPDSPGVEKAVDRAHHQWGQVRDKSRAQELGTLLAQLRTRVPGRRPGALENVRKQLRELQATPF
ncbi:MULTISPECIES: hypothetical protein [Streptomyces]|uniref:Uncharacterized protein n=1 Tax=Streptomyces sviceus (strain ATCC 29083 / DSM 924 / JCM 4929 / NBRC 13980 / NCIMB 11184 / NRRL 5439 / UC 5370) TaxID=463191 RepID=B5HTN7_STRX2|nr:MULTISPECIES: hypothetical protein [Streptomyces]EDY56169.1 conserved hypothetical protein [Streptomyces sviceus ATCC 29083]MYT07171.1 hypothetical protein [Streptomyces sp. SID5470]